MNHPITSKLAAVFSAVMINGMLLSGVSYLFVAQSPEKLADVSTIKTSVDFTAIV
jgi:CHASE3 domain sensor protein